MVARDLYHGPSAGVAPPNPRTAAFSKPERTEVTVQLRSDDPLVVDPGVAADFRIHGSTATATDVEYRAGGRLVLTLSAPADGATGVSYLSHLRAGPWIVNATGSGLLTFHNLPIARPAAGRAERRGPPWGGTPTAPPIGSVPGS